MRGRATRPTSTAPHPPAPLYSCRVAIEGCRSPMRAVAVSRAVGRCREPCRRALSSVCLPACGCAGPAQRKEGVARLELGRAAARADRSCRFAPSSFVAYATGCRRDHSLSRSGEGGPAPMDPSGMPSRENTPPPPATSVPIQVSGELHCDSSLFINKDRTRRRDR